MTEHPITPPSKLVQKWIKSARYREFMPYPEGYEQYEQRLTTIAARWGADMELEACCEWLVAHQWHGPSGMCLVNLRAARRPKPLSLKRQALEAVKQIPVEPNGGPWHTAMKTIIHALETLDD